MFSSPPQDEEHFLQVILVSCPDSTSPVSRQYQLMMVMVHELMIEFPISPARPWLFVFLRIVSCAISLPFHPFPSLPSLPVFTALESIYSVEFHLIVFNVKFNFLFVSLASCHELQASSEPTRSTEETTMPKKTIPMLTPCRSFLPPNQSSVRVAVTLLLLYIFYSSTRLLHPHPVLRSFGHRFVVCHEFISHYDHVRTFKPFVPMLRLLRHNNII